MYFLNRMKDKTINRFIIFFFMIVEVQSNLRSYRLIIQVLKRLEPMINPKPLNQFIYPSYDNL